MLSPPPSLLGCEREILVGSRVGMTGDQPKTRFANAWTGAIDERQLPKMCVDRALAHQLLDLVQDRRPLLCIELGRLLIEEGVDVRVAAIDIGSTLHHESLQAGRRIAERSAGTLDEVLVALFSVTLEEGGPLQRPQLGANADGLQIVEHGLGQ